MRDLGLITLGALLGWLTMRILKRRRARIHEVDSSGYAITKYREELRRKEKH